MKIRMLQDVSGTFHNQEGVKRGDVVDVDDDSGENYIRQGMAEKGSTKASASGPELFQVAAPSTVYVTKEEAADFNKKRVLEEEAAVNTPESKPDHDVEEAAEVAAESSFAAANVLSPTSESESDSKAASDRRSSGGSSSKSSK